MSYILSALKKAEQERHQGDAPDVLTMQRVITEPSSSSPERARSKLYLIGGAVALFASGLWLVKQLYPDNNVVTVYSSVPVQPGQYRAPAVAPSGEKRPGAPVVSSRDQATPDIRSVTPPNSARGAGDDVAFGRDDQQGTSRAPSRSYGDEIRDIDALPPSLRERLPPLLLSGHLYSAAHPQARKVILNGIALKEKQYLIDDLMVSEIRSDGVVLDFQGILFSMNAKRMFR